MFDQAMAPVENVATCDITADVSLPSDIDKTKFSHISAYIDTATMGSYNYDDPNVVVDLVMTVCITNPADNTTKQFKVVKRLSMDKCKLAAQAENSTPVNVVEDLEDDPAEVQRMMLEYHSIQRARAMAGLNEGARGFETFTATVKYPDENGNTATCHHVIKNVRDKAHARHFAELRVMPKYAKHGDKAKITRVFQTPENKTASDEAKAKAVKSGSLKD